jgi:hypothetical protein
MTTLIPMPFVITLNELIADIVKHLLINYVQNNIQDNYPEEEFDEETNKYMEGDYEIHLHYLIEKWKNSIDKVFVGNVRIDYNRQDTFDELWRYAAVTINIIRLFHDGLIDDIFERDILHTNIMLK